MRVSILFATLSLSKVLAFSPPTNLQKGDIKKLSSQSNNANLLPPNVFPCADTPSKSVMIRGRKLKATNTDSEESLFSDIQINIPYVVAYVGFLGYAYLRATTEPSGASQVILDKFLADPVNPGVNELFASIFNLLGLAPIPIGCITMPSAKGQKPPIAPFLLGGTFGGYGVLGIAMSTRKSVTSVTKDDLGWVTKNILENKIFNWLAVAIACSTFFSTGFVDGLVVDATAQWQGYVDLVQSTAIASASSLDLVILTLVAASVIPEDLERRGIDGDSSKAKQIAAATCLFPIVGALLYCALRPDLPEE